MSTHFGRRPSPSMVVSIVALIVAMAGTGYAATKLPRNSVGSKQIKKGAVRGSDLHSNAVTSSKVKDGSLTGVDVAVSSLGKVPSAANADHAGAADTATSAANATNATNATSATSATNAANADNAAKVNGLEVRKIFFREVEGTNTPKTILDLGGLQLEANCAAAGSLTLTAKTTVDNADIHASPLAGRTTYSFNRTDSGTDSYFDSAGGTDEQEDDNFDVSDTLDVADEGDTGTDSINGVVNYATPAGSVVSVSYMAEDGNAFGTPDSSDCLVAGTAIGG